MSTCKLHSLSFGGRSVSGSIAVSSFSHSTSFSSAVMPLIVAGSEPESSFSPMWSSVREVSWPKLGGIVPDSAFSATQQGTSVIDAVWARQSRPQAEVLTAHEEALSLLRLPRAEGKVPFSALA